MRYIPHTEEDVARMLGTVGVKSVDELFASIIPDNVRFKRPLGLPAGMDEPTLIAHLGELAAKNRAGRTGVAGTETGPLSFLGGGYYPHAIPAAVDALLSRSEFYTSYTPYQPEISQGTLQAFFEFQTIVCELFGLEVANASMYDGSTACAEAILMARRITGRPGVLLGAGLHPEYVHTSKTYLQALDVTLQTVPLAADGRMDLDRLAAVLDDKVSCVVVQTPSYLGTVADVEAIAKLAKAKGALVITVTPEPLALALMKPPGAAGADIAVGEGIGLAVPMQLGAPAVGLFATRAEHVRSIPGRLIGETVDKEGRRGYVLTLATREQHIRREKATSNICTNQGLIALAFTIHLSLLGRRGMRELARVIYAKTRYAEDRVAAAGYAPRFGKTPSFNELCVRVPGGVTADQVIERAAEKGVYAGVSAGRLDAGLADSLLIAVNETHTRADIDRLATVLGEVAR